MEKQTAKTILNTLIKYAEDKEQLSPSQWIDGAVKMTLLSGEEADKLFIMQSELSKKKIEFLGKVDDKGKKYSVAMANLYVETLPEWVEMKQLESMIKRIEEISRLAKKRASLSETEFKGY